jgi:hypothetical protein
MTKKDELCRDKRGLYVRNLGWKLLPSGGYSHVKFYLGRDETRAKIASMNLEQLWDAVCRRWEASTPLKARRKSDANSQTVITSEPGKGSNGGPLSTGVAVVATVGIGQIEYVRDGKPVWDDVTLTIADAIRNGETVARVPVPQTLGQFGLESPSVGHWLDELRRAVPFIVIQLRDVEQQQEAEAQIRKEGTRLALHPFSP